MRQGESRGGERRETTGRPVSHFFDSQGHLWETCGADSEGAEAFGPVGTARKIEPEVAGLRLEPGETPYTAAKRVGRIIENDETEWSMLNDSNE